MSGLTGRTAATVGLGQGRVWAVLAGTALPGRRTCCDRSNDGSEPFLTDRARATSVENRSPAR